MSERHINTNTDGDVQASNAIVSLRQPLVHENDIAALLDLLQELGHAQLQLATLLGASDEQPDVQLHHAFAQQPLWKGRAIRRHASHDGVGQALCNGRLAHTGLAQQDGVVFRAATEDLDHAMNLGGASDDGVGALGLGFCTQVTAKLLQCLLALPFPTRRSVAGRLRDDGVQTLVWHSDLSHCHSSE